MVTGVSGYGLINNTTDFNNQLNIPITSQEFIFKWKNYETAEGVFDRSYMLTQVKKATDKGLYVGIKCWVSGPNVNATPDWLYANGVPQVVMQTTGYIYPYFLNEYYKTRYQVLLDNIIADIASWPEEVRTKVRTFHITPGTTGDDTLYHGVPVNPAYIIPDATELAFMRGYFLSTYNAMATVLPDVQLCINQAVTAVHTAWCDDNTPNCAVKDGDLSHAYAYAGDGHNSERTRNIIGSGRYVIAEAANPAWGNAWWNISKEGNTMALVCQALYGNLNVLNIPAAITSSNTATHEAEKFFNTYSAEQESPNKGFCQCRDVIDMADTVRFSEATYGNLIDPSRIGAYTTQYNAIIAKGYGEYQEKAELTKIKVSFFNPARKTAIVALFPEAVYGTIQRDRNGDGYHYDFNIDGISGNAYRGVKEINQFNNSRPSPRKGLTSSYYHRFGTTFTDKQLFELSGLRNSGNHQVQFKITYFNEFDNAFKFYYHNGTAKTEGRSVICDVTNDFETVTFTLPDFEAGQLLDDGADFTLEYEGGTTAMDIRMIEVSFLAENTGGDTAPYVNAGDDITVTGTADPIALNGVASDDSAIASVLWSIVSAPDGSTATITEPGSVITFLQDYIPGVYTLRLTATDDTANESTDDIVITVEADESSEINYGGLPRVTQLHFIADVDNNTYYKDSDGLIKKSSEPTPLPQHPTGWRDIQISFATNQKYFSLNRAFTVPLKYVNNGADIIRDRMYKGKGYEEELYTIILKWNRDTGIFELEYKGKIDLSKFVDDPAVGVTVNTVEGGVLTFLNSNDGVTYEILCDETADNVLKIYFDGVTLEDKYNYVFLESDVTEDHFGVPMVFLNNEGDSVGVTHGDPSAISIGSIPDYLQNSINYYFKAYKATTIYLNGTFKIRNDGSINKLAYLSAYKSDETFENLINGVLSAPGEIISYTFDNYEVALTDGLSAFLTFRQVNSGAGTATQTYHILENSISVSLQTINAPSYSYARRPLDLWKDIVKAMTNGKYTGDSAFLAVHNNIVTTCGDALRNTSRTVVPNYKIATTVAEFFQSYGAIYDLGIKIVGNVLFVEPKTELYKADSQIFDIGEVADFSVSCADEYLVNLINAGAPDQKYDERNGKYEVNSTQQWKLPVLSVNKPLEITSKYRMGCFDIEFIRGKLQNRDTTDNAGDKQPFMVNIADTGSSAIASVLGAKDAQEDVGTGLIFFDTITNTGEGESYIGINEAKTQFTFLKTTPYTVNILANIYGSLSGSGDAIFTLKVNADVVATRTIPATSVVFRIDFVLSRTLNSTDVVTLNITTGSTSVNIDSAGIYFVIPDAKVIPVYNLRRVAYESITGVLDNTVFNIEEMTPHRQILAHGPYIKSLLYQQPTEQLICQTGPKNLLLSTTKDGVTITENAPIAVSDLGDALFLPYKFKFKWKTPYTFNKTLELMNTGYIKGTYKGYPFYCLPIGQMTAKPASEEAQDVELLAAPNNSLDTFFRFGTDTIFTTDYNNNMILTTVLNPIHWVQYNFTPNEKYHHKEVHDDWFHNRFTRFRNQPAYFQKWQTTDIIQMQFVTANVGQIKMYIYDERGKFVDTQEFSFVTNSAIQLPYSIQQLSFDISAYPDGNYLFVIQSGATKLFISEWQNIKEDQPNTYLFEYSNTFNKQHTYFNTWSGALRVEALFLPWKQDSDAVDYVDEPHDVEILNGTGFQFRDLIVGSGTGIPEYMAQKINEILLLNRTNIEGLRYSKLSASKFEADDIAVGYPMRKYKVEVLTALNNPGFLLDDNAVAPVGSGFIAYTLDAKAFGKASGVINITIENE